MSTGTSVNQTDEEIIKSFSCYEGPGAPGFITDFLGTRTRTSYISAVSQEGGIVEDYPIPPAIGNFHATTLEWAGVLRAVLDAAAEGATEMVAVELGAGWAPWLVAVARAAQQKVIEKVDLVGVEGSKAHLEYMHSHFIDNGLDPQPHTLLHGVVGVTDGEAAFPILPDPAADWGAVASYDNGGVSGRRRLPALLTSLRSLVKGSAAKHSATERVPCFSIATLLRNFTKVDLVHVDIQGSEYEVILHARQVLKKKVKRIVVGTHSRTIEQNLLDELAAQGWLLEAEESCTFHQDGSRMKLFRDGCQVWRNTAFDPGGTIQG